MERQPIGLIDFKLYSCTLGCCLHQGGSTAKDLRVTTANMVKFGSLLEELGVSHIFSADHVLQLRTPKKTYLDSWLNHARDGANEVSLNDDYEMLALE
jgi:hypothetical protein